MLRILFVCTGNTCRSPMAEALLRNMLSGQKLRYEVEVFSAGLSSFPGEKVSAEAIKLLETEGVENIQDRHSVMLDRLNVDEADLIFVMTGDHLRKLTARFPDAKGKVFKLTEYAQCFGGGDIDDPFGQDEEIYRRVLEDIRVCLKNLISKLKEGDEYEDSYRQ